MSIPNAADVLPPTLRLSLLTDEGLVSRSGRFVPQEGGSFVADRWVSGFFNARKRHGEAPPAAAEGDSAQPADDTIQLRLETVAGFYPNRANGFSPRPGGEWTANHWVSDHFNVRLKAEGE
jgi:hypothetical protein